jgi:hypothetical protein
MAEVKRDGVVEQGGGLTDNYYQTYYQPRPKNHGIYPSVQTAHTFFSLEMHLNVRSH